MDPSLITDDCGREFLAENDITVKEALELANINCFPEEDPDDKGRKWTVVQILLPMHLGMNAEMPLVVDPDDIFPSSHKDDNAMELIPPEKEPSTSWSAGSTTFPGTGLDSPRTSSSSLPETASLSVLDTGAPASPDVFGISMQPPSASRDSGATAGQQSHGQAGPAVHPACAHCAANQQQQQQGQVQQHVPQHHQEREQPNEQAAPSPQTSSDAGESVSDNTVQEFLRCIDSPFPPPYPSNTASTISLDDMSLLDSVPMHTCPDDDDDDGDIVPGSARDLRMKQIDILGRIDLELEEMDEQVDTLWAPYYHAQRASQEWATHTATHGVPKAPESSHATRADAADAGTALSTASTPHAASKADDRKASARRGKSTQKKNAKRRKPQCGNPRTPEEQAQRQLKHNELERQRRAAVSDQQQQLAKKLDFVAKQPPRADVLVATALTVAGRDSQACFNLLRETPPKQLELMRKQRDGPQLSSEEYVNQKQLTADIVNVIKIAMRAKTEKLPLKYPFTSDGQEQSTLYPGCDWIERFNTELQAIQEYNSTYVTQQVSVDQCHAYCLLQFPAIDPKSLEEKKRNPQQPKSKKKHNVQERERRLYNKLLLVLVKHLCNAQGLSERRVLMAARARVVAALDRFPKPSPYGDFLEFKRAHTGSKKNEPGSERV